MTPARLGDENAASLRELAERLKALTDLFDERAEADLSRSPLGESRADTERGRGRAWSLYQMKRHLRYTRAHLIGWAAKLDREDRLARMPMPGDSRRG